jgi:large subunit ribosomal protein L18
MATGPRYRVSFRRKREGRTDYQKRLRLIISEKPRLVVRKTSNHVTAQVVKHESKGDRTIASGHSKTLKKYGWDGSTSNIPAAYLTGFICAQNAIEKGIKEAVLDIGLVPPVRKSKIFAVLKGALDAGMDIPHSEKVLPDKTRIKGEHIKPEKTTKKFDETLKKIKKGGN